MSNMSELDIALKQSNRRVLEAARALRSAHMAFANTREAMFAAQRVLQDATPEYEEAIRENERLVQYIVPCVRCGALPSNPDETCPACTP